jgi:hypothetical protein
MRNFSSHVNPLCWAFSERVMRLKVPPDWRLTWLLLGVIVGLLGLFVIEVVGKRPLSDQRIAPASSSQRKRAPPAV